MSTTTDQEAIHTINLSKDIQIAAPLEITFAAVLEELGPGSEMPDGRAFPMKIEPWPGGRWYRDLGDNSGHLWGHVQVIKPPGLLEIRGPMFMSYPAINFVQYRLTPDGDGTRLTITHQAFGQIPPQDREGVQEGWSHGLKRIRELAERQKKGRK
jgi:Activator of Hsp90 ATPase homolog 1-like protein